MFSKACEYGLRALLYIAEQSVAKNKVGVLSISEAINSPQAFTGKILQQLAKEDIVTSIKGPYGGYLIKNDKLETVTLSQIVEVLDGDAIYTGCALGLKTCDAESPCPLHFKFVKIREDLRELLETTTLAMLVDDMDKAELFLKR